MKEIHGSALGGHSGFKASYYRARRTFHWPKMREDVLKTVEECEVCQRCKGENVLYPKLLQPLPIPKEAWRHISIDFIEGLPKSEGMDTILVVMDRFTKYAHFIALTHPYTAAAVAYIFLNNIFKLHGLLETIVFDRDPIFTIQV